MNIHRWLVFPTLAAVGALAGCSSAPSHDEVAKRIEIELDAASGFEGVWEELAGQLADDALDGMCASDGYRVGLGDEESLIYAWDATCLLMFEHQLSPAQIERAERTVVDHVVNQ